MSPGAATKACCPRGRRLLHRSGTATRPTALEVIVPGALDQRTGGYIYDARIVAGLRGLAWSVVVHELAGEFPEPDIRARASLARTLETMPDGAPVLIDGLALGASPDLVGRHADRLGILGLVHHPLADETGLGPEERQRFDRREREALSCCAGVIVTSPFTAARVQQLGVPDTRVRVVRPGTDRARPAGGPATGTAPRLLCVASVTPRKGQDVLVRALARLRAMPWTCVCAGSLTRDVDYADSVQRLVASADLGERVRFVGECGPDALDTLYDSSSAFVLPSYYEGYGMVLTDALVRGLPIVSTTGGAIPGTVPSEAGILVAPGSDAALSKALASLLADTPVHSASGGTSRTVGSIRRASLAAAALRHASRLPDWPEATMVFADAVRDLLRSSNLTDATSPAGSTNRAAPAADAS